MWPDYYVEAEAEQQHAIDQAGPRRTILMHTNRKEELGFYSIFDISLLGDGDEI